MREVEFSGLDVNFATFANPHSKWMTQVLRLERFAEEPPHGLFDVSVPQTVGVGVQHGGDHSVHYRGHCILPGRL